MVNLQKELTGFKSSLDHLINEVWEPDDPTEHLTAMTRGADHLWNRILTVGNPAYEHLQEHSPSGQTLLSYVITFLWAPQAKAFLILWRDVLFQQQKAGILLAEDLIDQEALRQLRDRSREALSTAAHELTVFPEDKLRSLTLLRQADKEMNRWRLQENPWPVYRRQLAEIPGQCERILNQRRQLLGISSVFGMIREQVQAMLENCSEKIGETVASAHQAMQLVEAELSKKDEVKPSRIASRLEEMESALSLPSYLDQLSGQLDQQKEVLPEKMQVLIEPDQGLMLYKEITFRRITQQWLDAEIFPLLFEAWKLTENISNNITMSLLNVRNRATLLAAEIKERKTADAEPYDITLPLQVFLKNAEATRQKMKQLRDRIDNLLADEFQLSNLFNPGRSFLPTALQSTITQLRFGQNVLLSRAQTWLLDKAGAIRRLQTTVRQEENLSVSEKVVRFLQNREEEPTNSQYNTIFLTKGYVGDSFWVGRNHEMERLSSLVANWKAGFRGAVLLTGQRFSGKTVFGESVAQRFFPGNTIRLRPGSSIQVQGRRVNAGYNLGEVLNFIRKYTLNDPFLVWIDDLELWCDPENTIGRNVRMLKKYIDGYSEDLFFMVSVSNWLKAHLKRIHDLDKAFQAEINLDRMPLAEFREAILIRHGATHKTLLDEKEREVTPSQFRKLTGKVYRATEGNVGEGLLRWAAATRKLDEERIVFAFNSGFPLPDFLTPDIALFLTTVMIEKKTNEYRLRKLFGPAFSDKYIGILQRLISIGLIIRQPDGWLDVNERAVNELGKMLERKNYLKFYHN